MLYIQRLASMLSVSIVVCFSVFPLFSSIVCSGYISSSLHSIIFWGISFEYILSLILTIGIRASCEKLIITIYFLKCERE